MMRTVCLIAAVLLAVAFARSARQVTSLPQFDGNFADLPFNSYSGFIETDLKKGNNLFYWFAESQNDVSTDPLLVWFQGGPGCSGMEGFFVENGPFRFDVETQNLTTNPWSWNRFANVLYVESPAAVGFSYCTVGAPGCATGDFDTAQNNLVFIQKFLSEEFPEFAGRDLWLTGESYAGAYVPQLTHAIIETGGAIAKSLQGFMIGNPVLDCAEGHAGGTPTIDTLTLQLDLWYWHGWVSFRDFKKWDQIGCRARNVNDPIPADCNSHYNQVQDAIGPYNPDDMYSNTCTGNGTLDITATVPGCMSANKLLTKYLNRADVQAAIHAQGPASRPKWETCSNVLNYTSNWVDQLGLYREFFAKRPDFDILIYSGDVDIATVPFAFTNECLDLLDRPVTSKWQRWTVDGETAGFVEEFDRYTFATVKGAGHEVPEYQPHTSFELISRFLAKAAAKKA